MRVFSAQQVTALYYLNPDWEESMGGQLRVHIASGRGEGEGGARDASVQSGGRKWDIEPVLDRLVLFRSDLVDHEVSLLVAFHETFNTGRVAVLWLARMAVFGLSACSPTF